MLFFQKLLLVYYIFIGVIKGEDYECPSITLTEDRRTNENVLRIIQYNTEWLYIDHYDNFDCPGSQCSWVNLTEAQTHMDYVTDVIKELNGDIINICEVEGCYELNMLVEKLNNSFVSYLKQGTDSSTGQNVGMITKIDPNVDLYRSEVRVNYPIPNSKCGYSGNTGSTGVSKHYITEYKINQMNIAFISAHLIAIPTDPERCSKREAQSQVLQYIINDYIKNGFEIIMLGDFNDYDGNVLDINSNIPLSYTLDILKGLYGEKMGEYKLISVAEKIKKDERYTDWWDSDNNCNTSSKKDYSMIDHMLVTPYIYNFISNAFIYHGYDEYCGKYMSDHYPIVVDFTFYT